MDVNLREQAHGMHPQHNMVMVSKYALVEKSPGVFLLGVQKRFLLPVVEKSFMSLAAGSGNYQAEIENNKEHAQ